MIIQHNLQAMNSNRMLGVSTRKESKSVEDNANKFQITNMSGFVVADIELTQDKSMELQGGLCENLTDRKSVV